LLAESVVRSRIKEDSRRNAMRLINRKGDEIILLPINLPLFAPHYIMEKRALLLDHCAETKWR